MTTQATLCYIIKNGKVLLINKRKGLGAGQWNGPGGKIEKGESPQDSAKRETYEEIKIVPEAPKKVGELKFFFGQSQQPDWFVHVFTDDEFDGIEKETEEAAPKWFKIDRIPYNEMWADDRLWMPLMFAGKKFTGEFYFDKECKQLLRHELREADGQWT